MARVDGVDIQSVAFSPTGESVEVVYSEARDTDSPSGILEFRTLVVPTDLVQDAFVELLDSAREFIDQSLVAKRNPKAVR